MQINYACLLKVFYSIRGILLMIISKRLEDAEFVMSKDELTYSAVIEDFKNASQIYILTYNVSKD